LIVTALAGAGKYTVDLARERAAAVAARDDADRRRTQAEALIGFMLGNLRPRLQQVGRLDLLEEVGNEATAYFKAVPPEALSGEELYRRSQSLYQVGQVYQARGNLPQAVAAYRDSLALMRDVASRAPENAEWQMGLINAHFYLGDALRQQGDLPAALEQFRDYARVAERLLARSSTEPRWQMEVAYGRSNTAAVLEAQGDLESALKELQISLPLVQQVSQSAPDNREWRSALANQHNRTGVVLHRLGRLSEARDYYRQDLVITKQLVAAQSQDAPVLFRQAIAASWLASALEDLGDAEAGVHRRAARDTLAALVARDASNSNWQREFAAAQMRRGDEAEAQDGTAAALAVYREAFASLLSLFKANPSRVTLRRDVAFGHARLARARLKTGQAAAAQIEAHACQEVLSPLINKASIDQDSAAQAAHCTLLVGAALHRQGKREQASQEWQRALTAIEPLTRGSNDPRRLQLLARALKHLGRDGEAAAVMDRILATGYRNRMFLQDIAEIDSGR
jgi:tetratricopeptide (TPR) repeat protein